MIHLAVWASGAGSNAEKLWDYFHNHNHIDLPLLICSKAKAPVTEKAKERGLQVVIFPSDNLNVNKLTEIFRQAAIEGHVLAGYTRPVPEEIVSRWRHKILNLHPALLPKYGGRGMYGRHVHRAVMAAGEAYSGITIHEVTEEYDSGPILFQAEIKVPEDCDEERLALLIKQLEHRYYAPVVEAYFCGKHSDLRETSL